MTPTPRPVAIPGLAILDLTVAQPDGSWFVESFHAAGMGLEDFRPVQQNISVQPQVGMTRGFHAEPWRRCLALASGRVMAAWLDLRPGSGYGHTTWAELKPGMMVHVPRGVAQAFQVLEPGTTLITLLDAHWSPDARARYVSVDPFDPELGVPWPFPRDEAHTPAGLQLPALADAPSLASRTGEPFKVLFVCTANICRSAYADVTARGLGLDGLKFSSAGTHGLIGEGIDPPMAAHIRAGDPATHRARQLTRKDIEAADLVLAMASSHRRYIMDEWPAQASKTFLIGQAARLASEVPEDIALSALTRHMWQHRNAEPGDEVADPYARGPQAAAKAAHEIDTHLAALLPVLARLSN